MGFVPTLLQGQESCLTIFLPIVLNPVAAILMDIQWVFAEMKNTVGKFKFPSTKVEETPSDVNAMSPLVYITL